MDAGAPRFGRYALIRRVSIGGMAEIFKAKAYAAPGEERFEKVVALKRLLPVVEGDPDFAQMLISEAKLAARLAHPRICSIYELGQADGHHYITMEYLYGRDLKAVQRALDTRALPAAAAADLGLMAAQGLVYAHALTAPDGTPLRIVHRDISPHNLMIDRDGGLKIIDFGIATFHGRTLETQAGVVKGKHAYMSPEQARRRTLDGRSDVWSLGVILYELSTGQRLFRRASVVDTLEAVEEAPIPPLRALVPDAPEALERAVMACLVRDPSQRADALQVEAMLQGVLRGLGVAAPETPVAALYRDLFGDAGAVEDEVTLAEYHAALCAAQGEGTTTDQREVSDATIVHIPDQTDLREYVARLGRRLPAGPAATPSPPEPQRQSPAAAPAAVRSVGLPPAPSAAASPPLGPAGRAAAWILAAAVLATTAAAAVSYIRFMWAS